MKITYVAWAGTDNSGVSCITEDKAEAIAYAGDVGLVVRICTSSENVEMCAVFRGRSELVWL